MVPKRIIPALALVGILIIAGCVGEKEAETGKDIAPSKEKPIPITSCTIIGKPGIYELQVDLDVSKYTDTYYADIYGRPCIQINSSDVTFDGANHIIDGGQNNYISELLIIGDPRTKKTVENVVVKNAHIKNIYRAIALYNVRNSQLLGNTIELSTQNFGIRLDDSDNNKIEGNTIDSSRIALELTSGSSGGSNDNTISGNTFTSNNVGIELSSGSGNIISNNNFESSHIGFEFQPSAGGNAASGNSFSLNQKDYYDYGNGNKIN